MINYKWTGARRCGTGPRRIHGCHGFELGRRQLRIRKLTLLGSRPSSHYSPVHYCGAESLRREVPQR